METVDLERSWLSLAIIAVLGVIIVASLLLLFKQISKIWREQKSKQAEPVSKTSALLQVLQVVAIALLPNVFLFIAYNINTSFNNLIFSHALFWGAIFSLLSVGIYYFLRLVLKFQFYEVLILLTIGWLGFWQYEPLRQVVMRFVTTMAGTITLLAVFAILSAGAFLLLKARHRIIKVSALFDLFAVTICVMFLLNFIPVMSAEITYRTARAEHADEEVHPLFRQSFVVDESLPSPDIYWIWVDATFSLEKFESFYGISQQAHRERMQDLGFVIYENAFLNAANTANAMSILFSPDFFDSFLYSIMDPLAEKTNIDYAMSGVINDLLLRNGLSIYSAAANNELFRAFIEAGYQISAVGDPTIMDWMPHHLFYSINALDDYILAIPYEYYVPSFWNVVTRGDIGKMLTGATPLYWVFDSTSIPEAPVAALLPPYSALLPDELVLSFNQHYELNTYRALIDTFSIDEPRFTYIALEFSHPGWWSIVHDYRTYPEAHENSINVMFNLVDMILENNPNAVIVLQSDHGFHSHFTQAVVLELGHDLETIAALQRTVLSAVLIPDEYGGLNAPLAPKNIARELVNRFVGENYELLP
ncbi:MAG: hypothetical protein FWC13_00795 [Oscillospiraceae bacterium]|nr:hypothetical protein [Oscillospiraceae bacterium]